MSSFDSAFKNSRVLKQKNEFMTWNLSFGGMQSQRPDIEAGEFYSASHLPLSERNCILSVYTPLVEKF